MSEDIPRVTAMFCNKANRNNSTQKTLKVIVIGPLS